MTPGLIPPSPVPAPPTAAKENPYRYGYRIITKPRPDGGVQAEQVPLTLEDVLHPQEGDFITDNRLQKLECRYLGDVLEERLDRVNGGLILQDVLVDWNVPDQRNTACSALAAGSASTPR